MHFRENENGFVSISKGEGFLQWISFQLVSSQQQNSCNFIEELESVKLALEQIVCNLPNYDWCFQSIFLYGKVSNGHAMAWFFPKKYRIGLNFANRACYQMMNIIDVLDLGKFLFWPRHHFMKNQYFIRSLDHYCRLTSSQHHLLRKL